MKVTHFDNLQINQHHISIKATGLNREELSQIKQSIQDVYNFWVKVTPIPLSFDIELTIREVDPARELKLYVGNNWVKNEIDIDFPVGVPLSAVTSHAAHEFGHLLFINLNGESSIFNGVSPFNVKLVESIQAHLELITDTLSVLTSGDKQIISRSHQLYKEFGGDLTDSQPEYRDFSKDYDVRGWMSNRPFYHALIDTHDVLSPVRSEIGRLMDFLEPEWILLAIIHVSLEFIMERAEFDDIELYNRQYIDQLRQFLAVKMKEDYYRKTNRID